MVLCKIRKIFLSTLNDLNPPVPRLLQVVEIAKSQDNMEDTSKVTMEGKGFSDWAEVASSFVYATFPDATPLEQERLVLLITAPQFVLALVHYSGNMTLNTWYHNIAEGMQREPQEMMHSTKVFLNHLAPLLKRYLVTYKDAPTQNHRIFNPLNVDPRQTVRLRAIQPMIDTQLESDGGYEEIRHLGPLPTCSNVQRSDVAKLSGELGQDSIDKTTLRGVFYLYRAVEDYFKDEHNAPKSGEGDRRQEVIFLTTHTVLSYKTLSTTFKALDLTVLPSEDRKALLADDVGDGDRAKAFLLSLGLVRNTYTDDDDWSELDDWTKSLVGIVARRVEGMYKGGRSLGWN